MKPYCNICGHYHLMSEHHVHGIPPVPSPKEVEAEKTEQAKSHPNVEPMKKESLKTEQLYVSPKPRKKKKK